MDETDDVTPVPSLSVGPTRQVNRQHDVMQQRRRSRAGHPKEFLWVVLHVFIECGGERISLLGISRASPRGALILCQNRNTMLVLHWAFPYANGAKHEGNA